MQKWWNWVLAIGLVCLLLIAIPISYTGNKKATLQLMFDDYIAKFNKTYKSDPAEYQTRFQHFMANLEEIEKLNAAAQGPEEHRARYGLTRLSDMSKLEYQDIHLSDEKQAKPPQDYGRSWGNGDHHHHHHGHTEDEVNVVSRAKRAALPLKIDWRTQGVIGPVRSQGLCGACWAFSAVGMIEAMNAIATGKYVQLSVQEAIDCAGLGNSGCSGGDICLLLDWLLLSGSSLQREAQYPLRLADGTCQLKKNATGVQVASFTCDDFVGAEDKILQALATHGPVAVAVNALTWQNYLGGVIQFHCSGAASDLNHAVEIVGYDLTAEVPYYIAKNSWGPGFGNAGYIHLAVGSNICGLALEVSTVDVK
ncbi:cathepsin O [Plutella xylostella]|uniref:cathepsin O n=1 Tax=Plutella xylostella TaxID=51655 RepID=UPI0020321D9A|nr:cathepsin O [Plutella xylostella]